ncbi:MAG: PD-(D/E)XK nuclease family protein, partial [Pyrinomonadaceae bacterium]
MKRILATAKFVDVPKSIPNDLLVLTSNPAAAATLGVPHRKLSGVAQEIVNRAGVGTASPLRSLFVLRSVLAEIVPDRDPSAEAARIRPILDSILRDGIDIDAMRRSGSPSAEYLVKVVDAYCGELQKTGLIDKESVLWKAGESIKTRKKILVYGYFRARGSDIRFIDKLAGDGSIFVVPSGNGSIFASVNRSIEWLAGQGWEQQDEPARDNINMTAIAERFASGVGQLTEGIGCRAFVYSNVDAEVRGTLAAAKRMIVEGADPGSIAIVCRKAADYEQTISAVADEYGLPVSTLSKTALADTKLGSYIRLVLEAVESDLEFSITARLLKHPYGTPLSDDSWGLARRRRCGDADAWKQIGVDLKALEAPQSQTSEDWTNWLLNIVPLKLVRERSSENAAELLAYESFRDALGEMTALNGRTLMDLTAFSNSIVELLETFATPTDPGRGGIAFHQPNTIIGAEFEQIFVLGMAEGMMPATTNEDAVIDFHEQRQLEEKGVTFDRPVEFPRWEALSFYYLLLAAKTGITLGYPKAIDIEEKIASPFFERLGLTPAAAQPVSISSGREELKVCLRRDDAADDPLLTAGRHQFEVERRRESALPYDEYDGVIGIPISPE